MIQWEGEGEDVGGQMKDQASRMHYTIIPLV